MLQVTNNRLQVENLASYIKGRSQAERFREYLDLREEIVLMQFIPVVYRSNTIHNTCNPKQLYRYIKVNSFAYLLAFIRHKTCGTTITKNHTNILLPTKVKLLPTINKTWERYYSLYKDCKYEKCAGENNNICYTIVYKVVYKHE